MAKGTTVRMWKRTRWLLVFMAAGFLVTIGALVRLQLIEGEELKKMAIDQSLRPTTLSAQRGTIYDSSGTKVLAQSASVWTIAAEPIHISDENREQVAEVMAKHLDMEKDEVLKKISDTNSYYTVIKRQIETDQKNALVEELKEKNLTQGIQVNTDYKRYYPYGNFMGPVLGFTGSDGQGLSGLEYQYDAELSGTAGRLVTAKNGLGSDMPFQYEQKVDAQDGYDLVLTIDEGIQHFLEAGLEEGIENFNVSNGACAVAMDVNTGAILGLATKGDYDPNDPWTIADEEVAKEIAALPEEEQAQAESNALQKQWRNKAISDTYYPGSVFKMCTGSMAMEEGLVSEESTFTCNYSYQVPGTSTYIHCWSHGHGTETFVEGLCNSCNPWFMHLGDLLGPNLFYKYFDAFGFTQKTGIDLPGEASTLYYTADQLNPIELATESFGQNFSITPIHMLAAASAIANGGYLVQPHVVDHMLDSDGNIVMTADTTYKRQVISSDTSERMIKILQQNATSGTAKNGYIAGYQVCGKTGTSQKILEDNLDKTKKHYIASYCGFAPADDPQVALLIYFDEPDPNGNYYGGSVAGPVFNTCMEQILSYLGVERKYTEEELSKIDTTAPSAVGQTVEEAKKTVEDAGLNVTVKGSGSKVIDQVPVFGETIPQGGTVVLYTDEESTDQTVEVPNLLGLSLSAANQTAVDSGVQIRVTGAALTSDNPVSNTQSIAEGTKVRPGTVITVNFVELDQVL